MNALTKYRHIFLVGLQSNLVYRWNFLIRGFFSLARLAVVFILWGAAYAGLTQIGGYSIGQTFTYFTALIALQFNCSFLHRTAGRTELFQETCYRFHRCRIML